METSQFHDFEGKSQEEVTKLLAPLPTEREAEKMVSVVGWIAMVQDTVLGLYELGLAQDDSHMRATYWYYSLLTFIEEVLRPRLAIPNFHKAWYWWMLTNRAYLNLAPRGHGKTTTHDVHYPLWRIITDHNIRIILACETTGVAGLMVGTCRDHLDRNYLLRECFGELNPRLAEPEVGRGKGRQVWSKGGFMVERTDYTLKDATYTPLGKREATLTRRGDIIIVDDPVPERRAATYDHASDILWLEGELYPVLEDEGQLIVVGTLKDNRDVYSHILKKRTGLKGKIQYKTYIGDAEVHDKVEREKWEPLWAVKWPKEQLANQKFMMGTITYNRNYRNIILSEEDSIFPMLYFQGGVGLEGMVLPGCYEYDRVMRTAHHGPELLKVIGIDPWAAMKVSKRSKYFATCTLGLSHDGKIYLLDLWRGRPKGKAQNHLIASLWDRYGPQCIAVESNSAQAKLVQDLWHEYPDIAVVAANTGVNKIDPEVGIESMAPYFERGQFRLPVGDERSTRLVEWLVEELHHWPTWETSDLLMATWIGWKRLMLLAKIRRWMTEDYQIGIREELPRFDAETLGQTYRGEFPLRKPGEPRVSGEREPRYVQIQIRRL